MKKYNKHIKTVQNLVSFRTRLNLVILVSFV